MTRNKEITAILLDNPGALSNDPAGRRELMTALLEKMSKIATHVQMITTDPQCPAPADMPRLNFKTSADFFDHIAHNHRERVVLVLNAYAALFDLENTRKMLAEHMQFAFDYTYPENLPKGLLPEVLSGEAALLIRQTIPASLPMFKEFARECFEKDVSSYDSNIFVTDSRIVRYRVDFTPDTVQDAQVMREILATKGANLGIDALEAAIRAHPALIRRAPAFYEIELTDIREAGEGFIGSRLSSHGAMPVATFARALSEAKKLSGAPVVSLGLYGEPLLHPDFDAILSEMRKYPDFRFLIETRGLSGPSKNAQKALELPNVELIVDLSAAESATFAKLKTPAGGLPLEELASVEERVKALVPKERVYIQFTRTVHNEHELMRFYEKWKDYGDRIIIRKPDTFGGLLDSVRVVDLSPVQRHYCYHLQRDLVIRADGTAPLCRQDFTCANAAGNILKEGLETCWKGMQSAYNAHWNGDFSHPALCEKCDEWWVFNF